MLSERTADHRDIRRSVDVVVLVVEHAAALRVDAEHRQHSGRGVAHAADFAGRAVFDLRGIEARLDSQVRNVVECAAQPLIFRVTKERVDAAEISRRVGMRAIEPLQPSDIAHAGGRTKQQRVGQRKHGRVGSDRQRQRDDDCRHEPWLPEQAPHDLARVLPQRVEPYPRVRSPTDAPIDRHELRSHRVDVAEALARGGKRIVAGHPRRLELRHALVEVEAKLVVDVGAGIATPESEISSPAWLARHARTLMPARWSPA